MYVVETFNGTGTGEFNIISLGMWQKFIAYFINIYQPQHLFETF